MKKFLLILIGISFYSSADTITFEFQEDGKVKIEYQFSEIIQELKFSEDGQQQRLMAWHYDGNCFSFDGRYFVNKHSCNNIRTTTITFNAKREMEFDRVYAMGASLSGEKSWILNLSKFIPLNSDKNTSVKIKNSRKQNLIFNRRQHHSDLEIKIGDISPRAEYIYFGKLKNQKSDISIALDDRLPAWMVDIFESASYQIYSFYEDKLDIDLNSKSTIVVAYYPDSKSNSWKGDVDSNGNIFMRFYGKSWQHYDPSARNTILAFIAHEIFHLFNSNHISSLDASNEPWLHEGLADAFALISLRELDLYSDQDFNRSYQTSLNKCNQYHIFKQANINQPEINKIYACGLLATLLLNPKREDSVDEPVDIYTLVATRDMQKIWKKLLSRKTHTEYSINSYRKSLPRHKYNPKTYLSLVVDADDVKFPVNQYIQSTGMGVKRTTSDKQRIIQNLFNILLAQNCTNGYGFWLDEKSLKIESRPECGLPVSDFYVTHINGIDIFGDLDRILSGINKEVVLSNQNGGQVKLKNNLDHKLFNELKTIEIN